MPIAPDLRTTDWRSPQQAIRQNMQMSQSTSHERLLGKLNAVDDRVSPARAALIAKRDAARMSWSY
jgi:hypothetical protein